MTHHHHGHHHAHHDFSAIPNGRLRRFATYASVCVATILIIAKLVAWFMTDSVAMLSSLLDSVSDLMASFVTAFGVASALKPPDSDHRYGHGKAEPLSALLQSAFIIGSAALLGVEAAHRLIHPQPVDNIGLGYVVMALAIVLTLALVTFQHHVVSRTRSIAVNADRLHYIGDIAVNIAVIIAFALHQYTGWDWFDPVFGIAIASSLLYVAIKIIRHAIHALMDTELPQTKRAKIAGIVQAQPGVRGVHDMRTRSDGERVFIDMHVEMDGDLSLRAAHELSVRITKAVTAEIKNADVVIHQDPAGIIEERLDTQIERGSSRA